MKRFFFPKKKRLVSNTQIKAVLARGRCVSNDLFTLYVAENNCGHPRLGVSVGKACGNAVVRSRLKRLAREAFRQGQHRIPPGLDYVLIVSPKWWKKMDSSAGPKLAVKRLTFEQVKTSLTALIKMNSGT